MYYVIDGYNLIFSLIESKDSLQTLRQKTILALQKKFAHLKLRGILVFDGSHRRDEESGLSYPSPLTVAYTHKGQSADQYIVEHLERLSNPKEAVVVTNDRGLSGHARATGAHVQSNREFIDWLKKKSVHKKSKAVKDTQINIDRLLKIFEEKLQNESDEETSF